MGKHGRHPPQLLEPLKPVDYIKYPDAIAGVDITRPRDIYSFLSLGYIATDLKVPTGTLQKQRNPTESFSEGSLLSSSNTDWNQHSSSSYVFFDTLNAHSKLPSIQQNILTEGENDFIEEEEDIEHGQDTCNQLPRKSLINEEDHVINITQTYIFAPPDRVQETFKYNKNVILPKIKPKKTFNSDSPKEQISLQITRPKHVRIDPNPTDISHRSTDMNASNYLFGVRPECLFLNDRLGERNPLLRHPKESPTLSIPKASPGLQDLKDYDEYPDVYWKLRDGTITQPEDLEADMIDRDLYRLRQISTLKLNTVERTFQVSQDPFRRWRWKSGEPIFSPRQQQRPLNYRSMREKKMKDIPIYPKALLNPQLKVNTSPLKPLNPDNNVRYRDHFPSPRVPDIEQTNHDSHQYKIDTPFEDVPALPLLDTPRESSMGGQTPREIVAASLESFRRMDEKLEEGEQFSKIPIQRLHQLKGKNNKLPVKTSLVKVDLDSVENYKKEFRGGNTKAICKSNSKGVGHSHKLESFREQLLNSCEEDKIDTARSQNDNNVDLSNDDTKAEDGNDERGLGSATRVKAPVSTVLLQPDLTRLSLYPPGEVINSWDFDTGTLSSTAANLRNGMPSPVVSDSSGAFKEKRQKDITAVRPKKLEVFAERSDFNDCIKIPTGRITYYKNMPNYKLDLINYPPSNARQSCPRSTSAGISDGRTTHFTNNTHSLSGVGGSRKHHRARSSGTRDHNPNIPPQSSGANTGVSIRFGQEGQVILSSSREGGKL